MCIFWLQRVFEIQFKNSIWISKARCREGLTKILYCYCFTTVHFLFSYTIQLVETCYTLESRSVINAIYILQ